MNVGRVVAVAGELAAVGGKDAVGIVEIGHAEGRSDASFESRRTLAVDLVGKHHELGYSYPVHASFAVGIDGGRCLACHRWPIQGIADVRFGRRDQVSWFSQSEECSVQHWKVRALA